jgi:hypothetical protein
MRLSRQLLVNVFGQLEHSSTPREYSNFQNGGKNVYSETGIMYKNKQMSVDNIYSTWFSHNNISTQKKLLIASSTT